MNIAAAATTHWIHDFNPIIIRIYGEIALRWYGLSYVLGILAASWVLSRWIKRGWIPLRRDELADFALYVGLGMVLGGRVGYCLLYAGDAFWSDPTYFFRIYEGGMASHGGIAGLAAGVAIFCWRRHRNLGALSDAVSAVAPIGVVFGRLANFVNGELWGRPGDVSWAVFFPKAPPVDPVRYPWVESLNCSTVAQPATWVEWAGRTTEQVSHWCFAPRHPSQLYAVVLEGVLPFLLLYIVNTRHRRPWLTVGWCFIIYGVGRFVGEFWREPDEGYELFFGWMSKGQLYTIPFLLIGMALIVWKSRQPARPDAYAAPAAPRAKS